MDYKKIKIVFMGTPDFAVASLSALIKEGCTISAVITAPDKPAGRGMNVQKSAVKKLAMEHGLKVLQPPKLKNPAFAEELKAIESDLQIVVAFRMLPEVIWKMPPLGTINLHGSLLPQYRGAAPINWAIINGEKITGVTTFKLKQEIDTGNILLQQSIPIEEFETAGELHDKMKEVGAELLVNTIKGIAIGSLVGTPQNIIYNGEIKLAPKIFTETCKIDWCQPVDKIYNLIRGLSPYPGAFTHINNKMIKIFRSEKIKEGPGIQPGDWDTDKKKYLRFAGTDGYIYINELQVEGKKKVTVKEFLRGFRF